MPSDGIRRVAYKDGYLRFGPGDPASGRFIKGPIPTSVNPWADVAAQAPGDAGGGPPVDPMLEAQQAAAQRAIQLGDAWDAYQTSQLQSSFGFDANGNIDPSNPYSRAMYAQNLYNRNVEDINKGYSRNVADLTTGYTRNTEDLARQTGINQNRNFIDKAASGQLNAGSLQNMRDYIQGNADRAQGRLTSDYNTGTTRLGEDKTTNLTRSSQDYGYNMNQLKQQLAGSLGDILKGKVDRYSQVGASVDDSTLQSLIKALS